MADDIRIESRTSPLFLSNQAGERALRLLLSVQAGDALRETGPRPAEAEPAGADLCLVLDVSGSMREVVEGDTRPTGERLFLDGREYNVVEGGTTKLQACVAAAGPLIDLLRPQDTLSLVTFSDTVRVVCQRLTRARADEYRRALGGITADGETALGQGILGAVAILRAGPPGRVKKIILMTDGNPQGEDPSVALAAGREAADAGTAVDCLGFGTNFNFLYMQDVVTPSRGRSDLLRSQADASGLFSELLRKAQDVVATNLRLTLTVSDQVRVTDHYRGAPENLYLGKLRLPDASRRVTLTLGALERDQRYDYYFQVTMPPRPGVVGGFRVMKAELAYDVPAQGRADQAVARNVTVDLVAGGSHAEVRDGTVEKGFTLAEVKRLEREREAARQAGDRETVASRFLDIIRRYDELGMVAERKEVEALLEEYKRTGTITNEHLNNAARSSSKAVDSGEVAEEPPDMAEIFGPAYGGRGGED